MDNITIGARVRCNKGFAPAFQNQTGTITAVRDNAFGEQIWTINFDTPTAAATTWPKLETLAATKECYDELQG